MPPPVTIGCANIVPLQMWDLTGLLARALLWYRCRAPAYPGFGAGR